MTSQMDTFEGAASAAGKLNSVLGGPLLNSMDLLNATEDERIRLVLQSVEASGRSWESMGKFEKKALASAAGITDMNEANKMFSAGLSGYDQMQDQMASSTDEQERLEAAQQAGVSIMEKMEAIFNSFAMAVMPIVDGIRWLMDGVLALNQAMGGMLIPVLVGVLGVIWAISMASKVAAAFSAAWNVVMGIQAAVFGVSAAAKGAEGAANIVVGASSIPAAAGTAAVGTAAWYAAIPVAILALGLGLLALGFGLIAVSIAGIVWAFVYLIQLFMEAPGAALLAAGALVVVGIAVATWVEEGVQGVHFGIKSSTLKTFASANGLRFLPPNNRDLSNKELGQLITSGTVYLECHMTIAKIKKMIAEANNRKAFFSEYR